ncbi:MAG: amidohydrolase [Armatimonadota bacterium]|nr:MAG: amidohydrolase [Armatimonadota bacterium]
MTNMPVIDFHTHAFPDRVAAKAMAALEENYQVPSHSDATLAGLRRSMAAAGIEHCVVVPVATSPAQVRSITDWAAGNGGSDLTIFGSLHPDLEDAVTEIARMRDLGVRGVKFHSEFQGFNPDEARMFPMYEALRDAGMIVYFHAGNEILPLPAIRATPGRIARVLDEFPGLTVIAAHMGAYLEWDEVHEFLVGRDIYFDTSFCLHKLGTQRFMDILRAHGTQHILFGTDSPWSDQGEALTSIRALPLTDDERRLIFHENARCLLTNPA